MQVFNIDFGYSGLPLETLFENAEIKTRVWNELTILLNSIPNDWNPHQVLEYTKMCVRTTIEKAQADRKKKEKGEEDMVNEELDTAINALANSEITSDNKEAIMTYIEDLRNRKNILIEEKGARLASRLKTNWFNEGEKSTRYFLRLLKRSMPDDSLVSKMTRGKKLSTKMKLRRRL